MMSLKCFVKQTSQINYRNNLFIYTQAKYMLFKTEYARMIEINVTNTMASHNENWNQNGRVGCGKTYPESCRDGNSRQDAVLITMQHKNVCSLLSSYS